MSTINFWPRSIALTAAFLFLSAAAANAHPPAGSYHGGRSGGSYYSGSGYGSHYRSYGSVYYANTYHGWSRSCYFPTYSCYGYYDPTTVLWYYWYQPGNCYLPVSSMSTYPPVSVSTDPSLPPGATAGPPGR